jgi:hypothetical protein
MILLTFSGSFVTSWESTKAVPDVGFMSVVRIRIRVLLPAPFGPRSPKISPVYTSNDTSSTAMIVWFVEKTFETCSIRIIFSGPGSPVSPAPGLSWCECLFPGLFWSAGTIREKIISLRGFCSSVQDTCQAWPDGIPEGRRGSSRISAGRIPEFPRYPVTGPGKYLPGCSFPCEKQRNHSH